MNLLDNEVTPAGLQCVWYAIGQRKHCDTADALPEVPQNAQQCRGQRKAWLVFQDVNGHLQTMCDQLSYCEP